MDNDPAFSGFQKQASDVVEHAYRAGYAAGYQSAFEAIMRAAQTGMHKAPEPVQGALSIAAASQQAALVARRSTGVRAAPGSVKRLVRDFVLNAGGPVTEHRLGELHPEVNRSSRYMAFRLLAQEGVIEKQGDAWVPASKDKGNPGADTPG